MAKKHAYTIYMHWYQNKENANPNNAIMAVANSYVLLGKNLFVQSQKIACYSMATYQ